MEDDIFSTVLSLHDAAPGTLIASRYRIISLLGKGGQAAVYKVADTQDNNRELALKLFSWENLGRTTEREHALARFSREYKVLSQLSHPNIVQVYDFNELHEACCFFVMECINGGSVSERIKDANTPLSLAEILKILL
ncbi:MAG TPA: protein kinase, partial [Oligoflexia bacterium]|nr:protein kinase [Oligoflexia bacterium]